MLKMTRRWTDGPFLRWKCVKLQPKGRRSIRRAEVDFFSSSVSVMVEGAARTPREELGGGGGTWVAGKFRHLDSASAEGRTFPQAESW